MTTTKGTQNSQFPRAIVHKQILDAAEANPDATLQEIASKVSGGNVDLVEQVLDEYGDPGRNEQSAATDDTSPKPEKSEGDNQEILQPSIGNKVESPQEPEGDSADGREKPIEENGYILQQPVKEKSQDNTAEEIEKVSQDSIDQIEADLSEEQLKTLRLIYEHPTASQREIASMLDVTHTTVYHRLNPIDRFTWDDRWAFVSALFDKSENEHQRSVEGSMVQKDGLQTDNSSSTTTAVFEKPALTQKIIYACIEAESIDDEELNLIVTDFIQRTVDTE